MAVPLTLSSVPAQTPYVQYVSSSGQTVFPYPFEITQDSDLVCLINGVQQPTDGGYVLTGQGATGGGNLTFTSGQTVGTIITLYRNISIARITQLSQNGTFFSSNFNNEFNRIYLIMQQTEQQVDNCLQFPVTSPNTLAQNTLPDAPLRANKYLGFNSTGAPVVLPTTILPYPLNAPVSVTQFGATGNGVTDDSTAINSAVASLSAGGGTLWYPPGTYLVNSPINDVANVTHQGAGINATLVKTGGNFPVFNRAGGAAVTVNCGGVNNMTIHGSWGANHSNTGSFGLSVVGSNGAVYENLRIEGCFCGVYMAYNFESFMTNVKVLGAGTDQNSVGFVQDFTGASGNVNNAMYFLNCGSFNTATDGWQIRNGNGSDYTNCSAELCGGFGFSIGYSSAGVGGNFGTINPQFMQFSNCTGDTCTSANWFIQGTNALPAQDMQFSNCWSGLTSDSNWIFENTINVTFSSCNGISASKNAIQLNGNDALTISGFVGFNSNGSNGGFAGLDIVNCSNTIVTGSAFNTQNNTFSIAEDGSSNNNVIIGNRMPNSGQILGANTICRDNQGFVTETSGVASIAASTFVVVTHGLGFTPVAGDISLTATGNYGCWVTGIGNSTFQINISTTTTTTVGWNVNYLRH
jgi:hypothetical protein